MKINILISVLLSLVFLFNDSPKRLLSDDINEITQCRINHINDSIPNLLIGYYKSMYSIYNNEYRQRATKCSFTYDGIYDTLYMLEGTDYLEVSFVGLIWNQHEKLFYSYSSGGKYFFNTIKFSKEFDERIYETKYIKAIENWDSDIVKRDIRDAPFCDGKFYLASRIYFKDSLMIVENKAFNQY